MRFLRRRHSLALSVIWVDADGKQTFRLWRGDTFVMRGDTAPLLRVEYLDSGELRITPLTPFVELSALKLREWADHFDAVR